jgi:hypothetical protein
MLFFVTLPMAAIAWQLGRDERRSAPPDRRGKAAAGEALGIAGTLLSLVPLAVIVGVAGLLL